MLGCTASAVHAWPHDEEGPLPRAIADRVLAARLRREWKEAYALGHRPAANEELLNDAIDV